MKGDRIEGFFKAEEKENRRAFETVLPSYDDQKLADLTESHDVKVRAELVENETLEIDEIEKILNTKKTRKKAS